MEYPLREERLRFLKGAFEESLFLIVYRNFGTLSLPLDGARFRTLRLACV